MKEWIYMPAGIGLAVAASALTGALTQPGTRAGAGEAGRGELVRTIERLDATLATMDERAVELRRRLAELEARPAANGGGARREVGGLDAAVARWMEEKADLTRTTDPAEGSDDVDALVDRVLSKDFEGIDGVHAFWRELRESGRIDEVIGELEGIIDADPNDPDLRFELGFAYLQKSFGENPGPDAMAVTEKADASFDRALELDENHWDARFSKAIGLSLRPAVLGTTGQAIRQFEILRRQQEGQTQMAHYSQTYYYLGNLYQQTGETATALEAWRRGAELFPADERIAQQLAVHERMGGSR